jgi:hypothetical protein
MRTSFNDEALKKLTLKQLTELYKGSSKEVRTAAEKRWRILKGK